MSKGASRADQNVLLDYITPFQIVAVWRAIRNRHFLVVATIIFFFLLKVVTIISTGMLGLEALLISSSNKTIYLNGSFSGTTFRGGLFVDSRPAYAVDGIETSGLNYPAGTTDEYTVELFYPKDFGGASSFTAAVDVFSASLECESGFLTYTDLFDEGVEIAPVAQYYNVSVSVPDCQIHNTHLDTPDWTSPGYHSGYYAQFQNVTCSNLAVDDAKHNRVMAAIAFSQGYGHNNNTMLNVSNVVCIPTYQIRKASVTMDPANNVLDVQPLDGNTSVLPLVSGYDIAQGVLMSPGSATNIASEGASLDAFFTMIENFNAHAFLEDTVLQSATQKLYTKIAVQVASRFLINSNTPAPAIAGSMSTVANRLVVRDVPLRFMEALSLLMLAITIFVIIAAPKAAVPRPMDSIAGLATVLARSPSLTTILIGTGYLPLSKIRETLKDHEFQTSVEHQSSQSVFSIHAKAKIGQDLPVDAKATRISVTKTMDRDKQASSKAVEHFITKASSQGHTEAAVAWIRPVTFSPTAKAALILTPCLMIVALEVLLRHSNANAGLVDITAGSSERYGWLHIPTLLVVLLGSMFNTLDSDMELFSPYCVLSAGLLRRRNKPLAMLVRTDPDSDRLASSSPKEDRIVRSVSICPHCSIPDDCGQRSFYRTTCSTGTTCRVSSSRLVQHDWHDLRV